LVKKIVFIQKSFFQTETERFKQDLLRVIGKPHSTGFGDAISFSMDFKLMKIGIWPSKNDLKCVMKIGQGKSIRKQYPSINDRTYFSYPGFYLINLNHIPPLFFQYFCGVKEWYYIMVELMAGFSPWFWMVSYENCAHVKRP
jgi:hypothetical protein